MVRAWKGMGLLRQQAREPANEGFAAFGLTPPKPARRLVAAGVRAGVLLAPVIPGLTDHADNLENVVHAAAAQGAQFLGARVLYLQPGTREHFLGFLQAEYPELLAEYTRLLPGAYTPKRFQEGIRSAVADLKQEFQLKDRPARKPRVLRQLMLGEDSNAIR